MPKFTPPAQSISNPSKEVISRRTMQKIRKGIPFYPDPTYSPPPKPVRILMSEVSESTDINLELNTNFKENSPFKDGAITGTYQRPDESFFQERHKSEVLSIQAGWYRHLYLSKLT